MGASAVDTAASVFGSGRVAAQRLAIVRMAIGVLGYLAPKRFGRMWVGSAAASREVAVITRAFAVRDFVLGFGTYTALQRGGSPRGWVEAGLATDATDAVTSLIGPSPAGRKLLLIGASMAGVAGGTLALRDLDEDAEALPTA